MNFKGADIRDVLQSIAELAGVNLVTDGSVQGNITVNLKNLSFNQALKLITQTQGLGYVWDGNTIVVATPERIDEIYTDKAVEVVRLLTAEPAHIQGVVEGVYPELRILADEANKRLILTGAREVINEATLLIDELDIGEDIETRSIVVSYIDVAILMENISSLYPNLLLTADQTNNLIIIKGTAAEIGEVIDLIKEIDLPDTETSIEVNIRYHEPFILAEKIRGKYPALSVIEEGDNKIILEGKRDDIEDATKLLRELDVEEEKELEIMAVDYADLAEIEEIVSEFYPDISLKLNTQNRELILHGKKKDVAQAISLLKGLDVPRKQVLIEARIEEISRTAVSDLGIDPNQLSQIKFLKDDDDVLEGVAVTWPDILRVLESDGQSETLANPRLLTLAGEEASLLIGDKIPVEIRTGEFETQIEYIDAGINLIFSPWVSSDGMITLEVNPKISSIGESVFGSFPSINTREADTTIRLSDGQTFAIGGLIQDDIIENMSRIPILAEIPIFGKLFEHRDERHEKTEIIIFITPHIIDDQPARIDKDRLRDEGDSEEREEIEKKAIIEETIKKERTVKTEDIKEKEIIEVKAEEKKSAVKEKEPEKPELPDKTEFIEEAEPVEETDGFVGLSEDELLQILGQEPFEETEAVMEEEKEEEEEGTYKIVGLTDEELVAILGLEEDEEEIDLKKDRIGGEEKPAEEFEYQEFVEKETGVEKEEANKKEESTEAEAVEETEEKPFVMIEVNENAQGEQEITGEYYLLDYQVKSTEDVYLIADKFGIDSEQILRYNQIITVSEGMDITIPVPGNQLYILEKGETLWRVHEKFNVDLQLLIEINNIEDHTNLPVGKVLVLPVPVNN